LFTGIIEEVGTVERITPISQGRHYRITACRVMEDLTSEDSISVSGVCLTVTKVEKGYFEVTAVEETLQKSIMGGTKQGDRVNLERAMRLSDRLGGHLVLGHVDGVGRVVSVLTQGAGKLLKVEIPAQLLKYTIEKGSIAVDGVSLTITRLEGRRLTTSLIPYTLEHSTLGSVSPGRRVNIEVDFFGKYVERFLHYAKKERKMGEEQFRSMGY
jgi:riboflavin synthase